MHILELDSFKLSDAVKFHNRLNPKLWGRDEQLLPEIREKLLAIADDFREFLGIADLDVQDITVSGSNAAYAYTPNSDIDLHLVVKFPEKNDVYQELFNAKKYQYNEEHNLAISDIPVELYVQDADEPPVSQGEYSVKNDHWIQVPRRKRAKIDDTCVRAKVEDLDARIHDAIASGDVDRMSKLWGKIKNMRQAGLDEHGEFGCENIAFKILRANGCIKELRDARTAARDRELSLAEQNKVKKPFVYGYKSVAEDATLTPDGVNPTTCMFLNEKETPNHTEIIFDFMRFVVHELKLHNVPTLKIKKDPQWSVIHKSFGRYRDDLGQVELAVGNRHIMDVLRTLAHELQHRKQDEREHMPPGAGETGSPYENEAHAVAGVLMRKYADLHPEYFQDVPVSESASGYIPTKKQAKDPRYAMALTVDIKPGQVGKEANKMALQTDKQGKPALVMKATNQLAESLAQELALFEEDLMEIKMTSKNLSKLAKEIPGVTVGLEFEMIVPNVDADDDSRDLEPDYDQDESVNDIDDAVNFFDDGDYNSRGDIRRLRDNMLESFDEWRIEKLDEAWHRDGFEFFTEYLDREEPFDEEEYLEQAIDMAMSENPNLESGTDEYDDAVREKLNELQSTYYTDQWEEQGRNYEYAREEFEQDHDADWDQGEWLDDIGVRTMMDIESHFGHVQWPHWTSYSDEDETDTKEVALNFMNAMGMDSVAVGSYHGYGGGYEKWDGDKWVKIGSNKPLDCFTIEPDGSLEGNSSRDTGLEFVSPPIPLEDIGTVMKKVQSWAADNGVYTGKKNATSMHTNISIPGYDLDKLDYLKAAILLGDEHVLRQFDRIGNTYAKPAINKVKDLVRAKPEKAKELLDKMKSHLDAAASKLIHSGATDKYTSINTKDNRIEYRSPGGDYLSTIADDPQKMIDTINRMVVNIDAAMDPNKYKEEYQKKLYKILTGQEGGRESKTGAKQDAPKDTKDLLNIFSRYAAGELPKAALKSFVRQAQLERKVARQKGEGVEMWWNVARDGQRMEVVATNELDAKLTAAKEWGIVASDANLSSMTVKPLRPYDDTAGGPQVVAQQPTTPVWGIWDFQRGGFVNSRGGVGDGQGRLIGADTYDAARNAARNNGLLDRLEGGEFEIRQIPQQPAQAGGRMYKILDTRGGLIAGDEYGSDQEALQRAAYWAQRRNLDVVVKNEQGQEIGRVSSSGEITPAGQQQPAPQSQQGNWGIWIQNAARFANQPGEYPRGAEVPLYRFPSREAAEQWIEQQRAARPNMRTDIEVREIEPAAQQPAGEPSSYELYRISDGRAVTAPAGNPIQFLATSPEDAESKIARYAADFNLGAPELFAVRSVLQAPAQSSGEFTSTENVPREGQSRNLVPTGPGPWEIYRISNGESVRRLEHTNRAAAEEEARSALGLRGEAPELYGVRTQQSTLAATGSDAAQGGLVDVAGEQPATGSFTGEWKVVDPNGTEIYRFSGVGNSQSDANNVAIRWLQRNPQHMQGGVEVLPVMG